MKNLKEKNPPVLFLFLSGQMTPFPFFYIFLTAKAHGLCLSNCLRREVHVHLSSIFFFHLLF